MNRSHSYASEVRNSSRKISLLVNYSKHFVHFARLDEKIPTSMYEHFPTTFVLYVQLLPLYWFSVKRRMFHNNGLVVLCMVVFTIARLVASDPTCSQLNRLDHTKLTDLITTNLVNTTQPVPEVFSALWCENNAVHEAVSANVSVSLPREMVVYGVSTRGRCSGENAYVNKFTVLYRNRDDVIVKIPMVSNAKK